MPTHPWEFPSGPWERLHIDHAGHVDGKMFLVIVDAYSKWIEVEVVKSMDAQSIVKILRKLFSVHGLPRVVVSDNGPGFASEELNEFLKLDTGAAVSVMSVSVFEGFVEKGMNCVHLGWN